MNSSTHLLGMHPGGDGSVQPSIQSAKGLEDNEETEPDSSTQQIISFINQAQVVIDRLSQRCEELERLNEILPNIKKEISSQIDQSVQMLQRALIERQGTLLAEMEASIIARKEVATKMHADFETRLQRLLSHVDLLKRLLQIPAVSPDTNKQTCGTTRSFAIQKHRQEIEKLLQQPVPSHPSEFDNMSFFPIELDQLLSMIRCAGAVVLTSIDAHFTTLTGEPIFPEHVRSCEVGADTVVDVLPCDRQDRIVCDAKSKEFTVAVHSRSGQGSSVEVKERSGISAAEGDFQSPLQLAYRLSSPGMYDLSVKLYGEHIKGSPYLIHARPPITPNIEAWIDKIKEISHMPVRINATLATRRRCRSACPPPGESDTPPALADINRLERGDLLFCIGIKGRGDGEFANPTGICVTRENKIVVADCNNATIQVFNAQGEYLCRIGDYGYQPGQLIRPYDVAETINGNYLVADFDMHCVTVFSPTGAYISRFGQRYLAGPKGLTADNHGRILVVDQKACMLCIFKPTGKFINRFGTRGNADNQFCHPVSVAVGLKDDIFVSDYALHCIKVFDMNGLYLFKFGIHGMDAGCLHSPTGLVFDKHDRLYIGDWGNNRIQVFTNTGDYLYTVNTHTEPLNGPQGLAIHNTMGRLLVTDPGNYCFKVYKQQSPQVALSPDKMSDSAESQSTDGKPTSQQL